VSGIWAEADEVVDTAEREWCQRCLRGVLPRPNRLMLGRAPEYARVFQFSRRLTDQERAALAAYLEAPGCTPERHRAWEAEHLNERRSALAAACEAAGEIGREVADLERRATGWSVGKDQ
jgi:hypothetical protein